MSLQIRTAMLLGPDAAARLARAHVCVVGLGAVGSYATEALARAGVGRLRLVDHDVVQGTNLNRQLLALHSTLGRKKVEVARERVLDIHPGCGVEPMDLFVHAETLDRVLEGPPDVLVDAIDGYTPKMLLLEGAVGAGIPVVSAMGAARKTDPMALRVGDLSETRICPLARMIRKNLRKRGIASGIRCVFSVQEPEDILDPGEPLPDEPSFRRGRERRPIGSLSTLTGIFGLTAANEALGILLGWTPR